MSLPDSLRLLGGRYHLLTVGGTDIPLHCYFDDVLAPVLGPILARPILSLKAGKFYAVSFRFDGEEAQSLRSSEVVKDPFRSTSEHRTTLDNLHQRLADAIQASQDPSERAVLETFRLPNIREFPQAYRVVSSSQNGRNLTIVDWGLRQSAPEIRRKPRRVTYRHRRVRSLWIVFALAALLISVGIALVL